MARIDSTIVLRFGIPLVTVYLDETPESQAARERMKMTVEERGKLYDASSLAAELDSLVARDVGARLLVAEALASLMRDARGTGHVAWAVYFNGDFPIEPAVRLLADLRSAIPTKEAAFGLIVQREERDSLSIRAALQAACQLTLQAVEFPRPASWSGESLAYALTEDGWRLLRDLALWLAEDPASMSRYLPCDSLGACFGSKVATAVSASLW